MQLSLLTPYTPKGRERVKALGLSAIELRLGPGFPLETLDPDLEEAKHAAEDLRERGIQVTSLGFYRNMLDPDPEVRAEDARRLRNVMRMGSVFGTDLVGVFAGRDPELPIEDNLPAFTEVWKELAHEAEGFGVRIAFENCTMFRGYPLRGINMAHTPAAYSAMFSALPDDHLGIEFDPSHCLKQRIDSVAFLKDFPERIFHLHVKDHERLRELEQLHGQYDVRTSRDRFPGYGEIDFYSIFQTLKQIGYEGPVTIEPARDPEFQTEEEIIRGLEVSIEKVRGWMAEVWGPG